MQGRGLKQAQIDNNEKLIVAPHAGAWIETYNSRFMLMRKKSPLMQGRGLKHFDKERGVFCLTSPLMQGRGLKRQACQIVRLITGRPSCRGVD